MKIEDVTEDLSSFSQSIDKIKDGIGQIGKESEAIKKEVNKWRKKINATKTAKGLNDMQTEAHDIDRRAVKLQVWKLMQSRAESIGATYDGRSKKFSEPEKKAEDKGEAA